MTEARIALLLVSPMPVPFIGALRAMVLQSA